MKLNVEQLQLQLNYATMHIKQFSHFKNLSIHRKQFNDCDGDLKRDLEQDEDGKQDHECDGDLKRDLEQDGDGEQDHDCDRDLKRDLEQDGDGD